MSLYLEVANHEKLADGWSYLVGFTFGIVNQLTGISKIVREVPAHRFYKTHTDLGFPQMVKKSTLNSKKNGILVKDRLQVSLALKSLDPSTFGLDEQCGTYTSRLNGFSRAKDQRMITPPFYIAGVPWTLAVYPKGKTLNQALSVYLKILPPSAQHAHYTTIAPTSTTTRERERERDITHDEATADIDSILPTSSSPPSTSMPAAPVVGTVSTATHTSHTRMGSSGDDADAWSYVVNFRISLLNQLDGSKFTRSVDAKVFKHNFIDWGFPQFIKLSTLLSPDSGFLDDDAIVLEVALEVVECIRPRSVIYTPHLISTMPSTPTHINPKQSQSGGPSMSSSSLTSSMSMSVTAASSSAVPSPFGQPQSWSSFLIGETIERIGVEPVIPTESTSQSTVVSIGSQYISIFTSKARRSIAMRGFKKGTLWSIDMPLRQLLFSPLHWAVFSGSLEAVSELLARQADVDAVDANSRTPLDWACYCGHYDVAKLLLSKGASGRVRDAEHAKPVHKAAYLGSPDVVQLMLHHFSNVEVDLAPIEKRRRTYNITNLGTEFVEASSAYPSSHTKHASSDSNPNSKEESMLLSIPEHSYDTNSSTNHPGSPRSNKEGGGPQSPRSITSNGASQQHHHSKKSTGSSELETATEVASDVETADTAAFSGQYSSNTTSTSKSIPIGAPSTHHNLNHGSPADFSSSPSNVLPSTSTSPSYGYMSSSPQQAAHSPSTTSDKSIHNRQSSGEKEDKAPSSSQATSAGGNTTIIPLAVFTPLQFSLRSGRSSLAEQLVEDFDCSVNCVDVWGRTPLHMAAFMGDIKLLELFLSRGHPSLVNYQDRDGFTALHKAIPRGYFDCVQVLLNAGSDVGLRSKCGYTPFHYAVLLNELQCAKLILEFDRRRGTAPVPLRDLDAARRSSDVVETDIPSISERKRATVQISEVIQLVTHPAAGPAPGTPHPGATNAPLPSTLVQTGAGTVAGANTERATERSVERRAPVVGILHHPPGSEAAIARQMQRMKQIRGTASDDELFEMKDAVLDGEELAKLPTRIRTVGFHGDNAVLRMKAHSTQILDASTENSTTDSATSPALTTPIPTSSSAPPYTSQQSSTGSPNSQSGRSKHLPTSDSDPDSSSSSDSLKEATLNANFGSHSGGGSHGGGGTTDDDGAMSADSEDDDDADEYEEEKQAASITRDVGRRRANTSTGVAGRRRLTFMSDEEDDSRIKHIEHDYDSYAAMREYGGDEAEAESENDEPEESSESLSAAAAAAVAMRNDKLRIREREAEYYYYRGRSLTKIEARSNSGSTRALLRTRSSSPPHTRSADNAINRQRSSTAYCGAEIVDTSSPADLLYSSQPTAAPAPSEDKESSSSRKAVYGSSRSKSTGTFKMDLDRGPQTPSSQSPGSASHNNAESAPKARSNKLSGLLRAFSQKTSDVLTGNSSNSPSTASASSGASQSIGHVTIASSDPEDLSAASRPSARRRSSEKVRRSSSSSSLDAGGRSSAIRSRRATPGVTVETSAINPSSPPGSPPSSPMNAPTKAKFTLPPSASLTSSVGSTGSSKTKDITLDQRDVAAPSVSAGTSSGPNSARSRKGRSPPPSGGSGRRPKSGSISTLDRDHALSSVVSPRTNSPRHALVHSAGASKSSSAIEDASASLTVGDSLRSNTHSKSPSDGSSMEQKSSSEMYSSTGSKHKDKEREKEKEREREKRDSDASASDKADKSGNEKPTERTSERSKDHRSSDTNGEKYDRSERLSNADLNPPTLLASNYGQLSSSAPSSTHTNGAVTATTSSPAGAPTSLTGFSPTHSSPPTSTGPTKKRSKSTRGTKSDLKVQINLSAVPASMPTSPVGNANPLAGPSSITPRSMKEILKEAREIEKIVPCPPTYTPSEILRMADINGWLPLHTCVKQGNLKMVEYVLAHGASVSDLANGVSVLDLAIQNMDSTLTTLLLERGAPIADAGMSLQSFISQKVISSRSSFAEGAPIPPSTLLGDMRALLNNSQFYDVTFVVEGKEVFGWRGLLATRCEVFRAMFTGTLREASESHINITDVSYNTFYRIIEFIYTDSVTSDKMTLDDALQLLAAANRYLLDRLKRIVERWLLSQLTDSNVAAIFHAADLHQAHALRSACTLYVSSNSHRIAGCYNLLNTTFKSVLLHLLKHPSPPAP